ncbi:GNAT family N-acetyltransferase [Pseudooceanicola sp.]|uniref:GNAT family N-acetyltransferase n=1 Tax=Pseudooceanicola sp. TaxID=1914328 RepID=UPI0035C686DE
MTAPVFRTASLSDIRTMLDWAAQEGWNPGLDDAEAFHAADPAGFFVAEMDGTAVAAISVVNHSDSFAFLGLYICRPDVRGRGVGLGLWRHALAHAGNRSIGLDGVPEQQSNYRKSGFALTGETRRYGGTFTGPVPPWRLATPQDQAEIRRLDRAANGFDRPAFLAAWVQPGPTRRTVVLGPSEGITGFATARLCKSGCKIGPIVAPDADEAVDLARQAAGSLGQRQVIIDVPDGGRRFSDLLAAQGFEVGFTTARMYKGPAPEGNGTLQAIATMELG